MWTRSGRLKHGRTPFALYREDWGHRRNVGLSGWCRHRLNVLGLRSSAHEQIVDQPLDAMAFAMQRESTGDRGCRVEICVSFAYADTQIVPRHLCRAIHNMTLVVHRPV